MFVRHPTPVQAIGRWRVTGRQRPVRMPGAATVGLELEPGDFILGDRDGVVVIPLGPPERFWSAPSGS